MRSSKGILVPGMALLTALMASNGTFDSERGPRARATMVGQGPPLRQPFGVDAHPCGTVTVLDSSQGMVLEVDSVTGDRTVVAGGSPEHEARLSSPTGAVRHRDGSYWIVDGARQLVYRTWPRKQRRLIVSGAGLRGTGPALARTGHMAQLPDGNLLVILRGKGKSLVRIHGVSGDRMILTGPSRGRGPEFLEPDDLVVTPGGRILVADNLLGAVLEVDPLSGDRRIALDVRRLPGPRLFRPYALGLGVDGTVLVAHPNLARAIAWNPSNGKTRLLTTPERGEGVLMAGFEDLAGLPGGAIVCANARSGSLVRVDPDGRRTVLSGRALPVGRMDAMLYAIAREGPGLGVGVDGLGGRVLRFSTSTGAFRVVSGPQTGSGPPIDTPNEIALDGRGRAYVVDWLSGLVEVTLAGGDRRALLPATPDFAPYDVQALPDGRLVLLDAISTRLGVFDPATGTLRLLRLSGPTLQAPLRVGWAPPGRLLLTDSGADALVEVDPETGRLTDISRGGVAPGPRAKLLEAVAGLRDGTVVISDDDRGLLLKVGAAGQRSVLSGPRRGDGPRLDAPEDLFERRNGNLLVCDPGLAGLVEVHPVTGGRRLLRIHQDSTVGTGLE